MDNQESEESNDNVLPENNCTDDDNESTSSEDLDLKLKYGRLANDLQIILTNDSASCIAVHPKFVCIGTDWGVIHLLDHQGNSVKNKALRAHSVAVNQISIDAKGDYIASCSDDGKVLVFGLYSSDNNHDIKLGRLVRSIAIDPNYYKSGSGRRFITGDERLVLHEKVLFARVRSTVIAEASQEGGVKTMKWSPGGEFLAWASHVGFRVYDLVARASLGLVKWSNKPQVDMKCHICWKNTHTLIVGWADTVWVCNVERRSVVTPMNASVYVVCPIYTFQTEFWVCGVSPLNENLVLLGCLKDTQGERPQLHIVKPEEDDYTDLIIDSLSLRGFQKYTASEYSLECLVEESRFVILSPKDIVAACPYDSDDKIDWLLEHCKFENALEVVSSPSKSLQRHSLHSVGRAYLDHLLASEKYDQAALHMHKILGNDKYRWEKEVIKFATINQLRSVAKYLPCRPEEALSPYIYEMVLSEYLKNDSDGFLETVKKWSCRGLYNVQAVINVTLEHILESDPKTNMVLLEALAILYSYSGQHDKALAMYIKIQNKGVFDLIRSHNLYTTCQSMLKELMNLDANETISVLMEKNKVFDRDLIVSKLSNNSYYLYLYLDALERRDPKNCYKYHALLVKLYADFNREKLLPLLKESNHFSIQEALDICQEHSFLPEMVYLLGRIGNTQEALSLLMKIGDIEKAINFCKEHDDQDLWEDLINYSLKEPEFITILLQRIAAFVDPRMLVQRIESGIEVPGLKASLVKMLQDYNLQVSVQEGCNAIIAADHFNLHQRVVNIQQKGTLVGDEHFCGVCHLKIITKNTKDFHPPADFLLFHCNHIFHESCLPSDSKICRICTTQKQRIIF